MNAKQTLTPKEAREILGVSRSTMYRMIKLGNVESYRVGSGRGTIRITLKSLKPHLKSISK